MGIKFDEMLSEIDSRLKKDYENEMWAERIKMFFNIIEKHFEPDLIVHSHLSMQLMDLNFLKELAIEKNDDELKDFCDGSVHSVHAQLIGWLVAPYMACWFTELNRAY